MKSTTDLASRVRFGSQERLAAKRKKLLAQRTSDIPLSLQKELSMHLNRKEKLAHDYRDLAENVGLKQMEIWALERFDEPTNELLQKF